MEYKGKEDEKLIISVIKTPTDFGMIEENDLTLLWFVEENNHVIIDCMKHIFKKNQIICLTEFHHIKFESISEIRMVRFNRNFYCITTHDSEIGCRGILFFGASSLPIITIPEEDLPLFEAFYIAFIFEIKTQDNLQLEMLQMMLKRLLILCMRVYKKQVNYTQIDDNQISIVKEYNFLVEQYFRTKHTVAEYADILNKSSKTLSNLFAKISSKTPLQFIQDRKILEAKRLLRYTDKSVKEIAYEIGFVDIQTFSRFFKNIEGVSPSGYKLKSNKI